jgi:hypothetical protein
MKLLGPLTATDIAKSYGIVVVREYDASEPDRAAQALVKLLAPKPHAEEGSRPN